jgi:hypothetical protein
MSIASEVGMEVVPARAVASADAHNWVRLAVAVDIDPVDDAVRSPMVDRPWSIAHGRTPDQRLDVGQAFRRHQLRVPGTHDAQLWRRRTTRPGAGHRLHRGLAPVAFRGRAPPAGERYRIGTVRSECRWAGDVSSRHVIGRAVTPPLLKLKVYRDVVADVWAAEIVEAAGW